MPPPKRQWPSVLAGYVVSVGLLVLVATPVYLSVEPAYRTAMVRLSVAIILGIVLIHLTRMARTLIDAQPPSAFERALQREPVEPRLAPLFLTLRDEVRFSLASQQYFERVLWLRILALLTRRPGDRTEMTLAKPPGNRFLRRGPSLAALRELIARIEERP